MQTAEPPPPHLNLGVVPDFREENWPSMDIVADRLMEEIGAGRAGNVAAQSLCPAFKKRLSRLPIVGSSGLAFNADRVLNRMRDYPAQLRKRAADFDAFHVCDHAYANVVHALPSERTGVFCHDLDTFRCLLEPEKERRSRSFKAMMRRVLSGFQKAAVVFHTTQEIRRQIVARGVIDEKKLVRVLLGVASGFCPSDDAADRANAPLQRLAGRPYVLHVGSGIPRKRIDVLLRFMAGLCSRHLDLYLVKVGDPLLPAQRALAEQLNLPRRLIETGRLNESELAGLYRHARAVVQPSDAEGFGLPVAEALACGCPVLASAIPTLMEVGGDAAEYCPVGDVDAWVGALDKIIQAGSIAADREKRLRQAAKYSWTNYARTICGTYHALVTR